MDLQLIADSIPELIGGVGITLQLLSVSLLAGMCIGLPMAFMRLSKNPLIWVPAHAYIFFFRGSPLLVQIFLVYYGLSQFEAVRESWAWPALRSAYSCALITFSLHTAAYAANIIRGAIIAVPSGEIEAARACGMTRVHIFRTATLPYVLRIGLPPYSNEVIGMLKGTALVSTITVADITGVARTIVSKTFAPYEIFIAAAILYLVITFIITRVFILVERRLAIPK